MIRGAATFFPVLVHLRVGFRDCHPSRGWFAWEEHLFNTNHVLAFYMFHLHVIRITRALNQERKRFIYIADCRFLEPGS